MDLGVNHRGTVYHLNPRLVRGKALDATAVDALKAAHRAMIDLRHEAVGAGREDLRRIAREVERLEFEMQGLWGFERDATRHTHWLTIPGCTCPVRANQALWGHPVRLVPRDCPVFGGETRDDGILLLATETGEPPRTLLDDAARVLTA